MECTSWHADVDSRRVVSANVKLDPITSLSTTSMMMSFAAIRWVKEALFGALDVGRGRFIMVGNLISKTSVLADICKTKGVHVSEVKAVDGEGNPTWREKLTKEEARA